MDYFAQHFFNGDDRRAAYARSRGERESFVETIAKGLAKSAVKRMAADGHDGRSRAGGIDADDLRSLGGFVMGMMGRRDDNKRREAPRHRDRRKRGREFEEETARNRYREDDEGSNYRVRFASPRNYNYYSPDQRWAEPAYPEPPRKHKRDRREWEGVDDSERRRQRRRHEGEPREGSRTSRKVYRRLNLKTLQTELEDMSGTIIKLSARSPGHRDCEFYDKFVSRGGRLQEVIGDTLGRIRKLEERGYGDVGGAEDVVGSERKRRRRRE